MARTNPKSDDIKNTKRKKKSFKELLSYIFDTEYFKLEEYNPGSAGVALAKRLRIAINIIRLYGATIFFLAYYLIFYVLKKSQILIKTKAHIKK